MINPHQPCDNHECLRILGASAKDLEVIPTSILLDVYQSLVIGDDGEGEKIHVNNFPLNDENVNFLCEVAVRYHKGDAKVGLVQDMKKALDIFTRIADAGNTNILTIPHSHALFGLAVHYEKGKGTSIDVARAVDLYRQAAELGHAKAQFNLAMMYRQDSDFHSLDEARRWFKAASENDSFEHTVAPYKLGDMYRDGVGGDLDEIEAVKWYEIAAQRNNIDAMMALGNLYYQADGNLVAHNDIIDTRKIIHDNTIALKWYLRTVEVVDAIPVVGQSKTMIKLREEAEYKVMLLQEPYSIQYNYTITKLRQNALSGRREAQYRLGNLLLSHESTYKEGMDWLHTAADDGKLPHAMMKLGIQYAITKILPHQYINLDKSEKYFQSCIDHGYAAGKHGQALLLQLRTGCNNVDTRDTVLRLLIDAAVEGNSFEAWKVLAFDNSYHQNPILYKTLDVEHLIIVENLRNERDKMLRIVDHALDGVMMCYDPRCIMCRSDRCLSISQSFQQTAAPRVYPGTHIVNQYFVESPEEIVGMFSSIDNSSKLGEGGFGEVRKASLRIPSKESTDGRLLHVALKKFSDKNTNNGSTSSTLSKLEAIKEEFYKLKLFQNHTQYITVCYGHVNIHNEYFLVMELAPLGDLLNAIYVISGFWRDHCTSEGLVDIPSNLLPIDLMLQWMFDIAQGLHCLHRYHLMHLDIKPQNILIYPKLRCKLADFGLAQKEGTMERLPSTVTPDSVNSVAQSFPNTADSTTITDCAAGRGTLGYMAPEILLQRPPQMKSDIFSLGMTYAAMINQRGSRGFWGDDFRDAKFRLQKSVDRLEDLMIETGTLSPSNSLYPSYVGYSGVLSLLTRLCEEMPERRETSEETLHRVQGLFKPDRLNPDLIERMENVLRS